MTSCSQTPTSSPRPASRRSLSAGTVNWHVMRLMDEILEVQCGPEKHDALMAMKVSWADEPCATQVV